jgi:hypothetical protein
MWNINNSIVGFEKFGCAIGCHGGEPGKPYGNKYLEEAGELGDLWHMKWVRGGYLGQIDDGYRRSHPLRSGEGQIGRPQDRPEDRWRLR